jgi:hypothetical protein
MKDELRHIVFGWHVPVIANLSRCDGLIFRYSVAALAGLQPVVAKARVSPAVLNRTSFDHGRQ